MFHIIDEHFFVPLASPNKLVYWECICKLFSVMDHQLSFGVERDVLVEELQYYFELFFRSLRRKRLKESLQETKQIGCFANWRIMVGLILKQTKAMCKE